MALRTNKKKKSSRGKLDSYYEIQQNDKQKCCSLSEVSSNNVKYLIKR